MTLEFDGSNFLDYLNRVESAYDDASDRALERSIDDLLRISSQIAPLSLSTLRKTGKSKYKWAKGGIGEVWFSATENTSGYGRFNYALWTHEMDYNLGEKSAAAPGTDGYHVGNKYIERPLKGQSDKYVNWWAQEVRGALD